MRFPVEQRSESPAGAAVMSELSNRKLLASISTLQMTLAVFRRSNVTSFVSEHLIGDSPLKCVEHGPLPLPQTKYLFFLLAQTVAQVHSLGLSGRDWKPSGFLICGSMIRITNYS
jgi:serine/threonine protein kinase